MIRKYTFSGDGTVEFDDAGTVEELIAHAFAVFGYEEPMGMERVTVYQASYPGADDGWFTTDVKRACREEIKNSEWLFFAYHLPNVFYVAEGGWGHHMPKLGNRPEIPNEVSVQLRTEEFRHTVVINGQYTFRDVVRFLQENRYLDSDCSRVEVVPIGCATKSWWLPFSDPIMDQSLTRFVEIVDRRSTEDYYTVLEFRLS